MDEKIRFRPPPEPAHVSLVRRYEDLIAILKQVRDKVQVEIDQGFHRVSRLVGFVVSTTIPVRAEVAKGGKIKELVMRGEHLEGTLFEKELLPPLNKIMKKPIPQLSEGTLDFYLVWFDALKLKLGSIQFRPPPEPAHFRRIVEKLESFRPPPEPAHVFRPPPEPAHVFRPPPEPAHVFRPPPEPAHWFDPGVLISEAEQVIIVTLDEVYPELRLVERISSHRMG